MKNQKGITIITLVVTIIILIMLAGVSLNMLLGENGIITKAKEAAKLQEIATIKEEIGLKILEQEMETQGTITQEKIETILLNYGTVSKNEDGTIKSLIPTGKDYEIAYEDIYIGTIVEEGNNNENADNGNNGSDSDSDSDTITLKKEEYDKIIERLDAIDGGTKTSASIPDISSNMNTMQSSINNINSNLNNKNSIVLGKTIAQTNGGFNYLNAVKNGNIISFTGQYVITGILDDGYAEIYQISDEYLPYITMFSISCSRFNDASPRQAYITSTGKICLFASLEGTLDTYGTYQFSGTYICK